MADDEDDFDLDEADEVIELDENDLKSCLSFSHFLHCPTLI